VAIAGGAFAVLATATSILLYQQLTGRKKYFYEKGE
jgi:hypothetical protein